MFTSAFVALREVMQTHLAVKMTDNQEPIG